MGQQSRSLFQLADTNGDGTGGVDAIGNYSAPPGQEFRITPPLGEILYIDQMLISITDGAAMSGSAYGSDVVLTAGIEIQVRNSNDDVRQDVTEGLPLITNADLSRIGVVTELVFGLGDQGLQCLVTLEEPIIVRDSERLAFRLNDDFSGLVHHYFTIIGKISHAS